MDIVLVHESDGVAVLEVKGHRPEIVGGVWANSGEPMNPQPLAQARNNAYELRELLRATHPTLRKMQVAYGVIFPNAGELRGTLPPDVDRAQILVASDLEDPLDAVDRLTALRWTVPIGAAGLRAIVDKLCPSAELAFDAEARARLLRLRLDELSERQVQALETLDMNRRVTVTGGAGTGKTRLASAWARRAGPVHLLQRSARMGPPEP
jgi:phosphate starvation-inducible protein PhoH